MLSLPSFSGHTCEPCPQLGAAAESHSSPGKRPLEWLRDVDPSREDGYPIQVSGIDTFIPTHSHPILINTQCIVAMATQCHHLVAIDQEFKRMEYKKRNHDYRKHLL